MTEDHTPRPRIELTAAGLIKVLQRHDPLLLVSVNAPSNTEPWCDYIGITIDDVRVVSWENEDGEEGRSLLIGKC